MVVMALFLIFRPLCALFEPLPRPDPASIRKMLAEGGLSEIITFLGWKVNTRLLTVALPSPKAAAWRAEIDQVLLESRAVKFARLQSLIGKLGHVCFIIPDARHFMNNLRRMEHLARFKKRVKLSRSAKEDLKLWLRFLDSAERGISINRIVFRKPNVISFTDASGAGMGGFLPTTGIAWRHRFTDAENKAQTLNAKDGRPT